MSNYRFFAFKKVQWTFDIWVNYRYLSLVLLFFLERSLQRGQLSADIGVPESRNYLNLFIQLDDLFLSGLDGFLELLQFPLYLQNTINITPVVPIVS